MGRRLPTDRARGVASVALAAPPPHPRWVDGARLCAGSCCSKPPTPEGRLQLRKPRGAQAARGLAKPQVCYETLPVVETFLRDRLPHLLPWCLLPPHSPSLALFSPWVSGPDSFLSVSLSLSNPVTATSTGEQHFLLRLSLSGIQPWGALRPSRSRQPLNSHSSKATYQLGDLGQVT